MEPQARGPARREGPGSGSQTSRGRATRASGGRRAGGARAAIAANTAQRAAPEGPRPGPCCGQTLTNGCGGGWVPTVSRGSEGADQRDSTSRLRSNGPDVTVMPGLIQAFASGGQQGRDTENTVSHGPDRCFPGMLTRCYVGKKREQALWSKSVRRAVGRAQLGSGPWECRHPKPRGRAPAGRPHPAPQAAFLRLRSRFWKTWETLLHKDTAIHPNAMKHRQNKGY